MKWMGVLAGMLVAQAAMADSAYVDFDLGLIFPQKLGGMPCDQFEKYNNEDLGYTLFYSLGEAFSAEVSVLNMGRTEIPDGPSGDGVVMILQSVENLLEMKQEGGAIANLKKRGSTVVPNKAPIQFLNQVFQYSDFRVVQGRTNSILRINSAYAAGAKNNFIKVEFNFDVVKNKDARAMADQLVKQLILLLVAENSEEELLLAACDIVVCNPADYSGKAAAQLVFAKAQTMGSLNVYADFFVWPQGYSKPENADLLMAAYFAGMLKVVIPQKLEHGGEFEAFFAMLTAYENMRARDQIKAIPQLEEWAKNPDKKALYEKLLVEFNYAAP